MSRIQNLLIIVLFIFVLVGCQKDQEIDTTSEVISSLEVGSNFGANSITTLGRSCGSKEHMQEKLQNSAFKKEYDLLTKAFEEDLRNNVAESRSACSNPKVLPVAIHFQGISNPNKACLTSLAKRQLTVLNNDFQGKNADIVQWRNTASASFPAINNGEACLEFCLATKNHPTGYGLTNGQLAITFNQTNGDQLNKWAGYINIVVGDADGNLGYAPLGGIGNGDAVVISKDAFGIGAKCGSVGPTAPYSLGRTLTHEMGHYLNLDHLWGDGGCASDDRVADTPKQSTENSGCPTIGVKSCNSKDLHMNYMDYADDVCMYMFTAGQKNRMESWVNGALSNRLKSPATVCGSVSDGGTTGGGTTNTGTCSTPTGLAATQTANTSLKVTWNTGTNIQTYQVRYRKKGTTTWSAKNTVNTQHSITGLSSGQTYQYRLRARCTDGKWTTYTPIKTIILQNTTTGGGTTGCAVPTGLTAQATNNTTLKAAWNAGTNVKYYQLHYRKKGTTTWKAKNAAATATSVSVASLVSGADYQYRLRTRCTDNKWSAFTPVKTLKLVQSGGGTATSTKVTIKLTLDDYGSENTIAIEDVNGKVLKKWGPFGDNRAGTVITRNIALLPGSYTFVIEDAHGDGICCFEGNGKWELLKNGTRMANSDGRFGYWEEYDFAIGTARISGPARTFDPIDLDKLATKVKPALTK